MSVKVKLEKNGYIKNGFTGFSWTTIFFGFWVPLFRLKLKDFLMFFIFFGFKIFPTFYLLYCTNTINTICSDIFSRNMDSILL